MSRLTVFADAPATTRAAATLRTEDPARIAAALAPLGVRFERWDGVHHAATLTDPAAILDAYRPHLDALMAAQDPASAAGSADVITLTPDHPQRDALREKFLHEHTHTEHEIRFFVRGSGHFILHTDGRVFDILCTQGDLIFVPAGIPHWFDAGEQPSFTALRVFTDPTGWVPHYTGSPISERFPAT